MSQFVHYYKSLTDLRHERYAFSYYRVLDVCVLIARQLAQRDIVIALVCVCLSVCLSNGDVCRDDCT